MLLLFRKSNPFILFALVVYALLLRAFILFLPLEVPLCSHQGIMDFMADWLFGTKFMFSDVMHYILSTSVVLFLAFYLQAQVVKHKIAERSGFLPAFFVILLCSAQPEYLFFTAPLLSMVFVLVAVCKIYATYFTEKNQGKIFDAAFCLSISAIIYFPNSILLLSMFIALVLLRTISLRDVLVYFTAYFIPIFLLFTMLFVYDQLVPFLTKNDFTVFLNHGGWMSMQPKPMDWVAIAAFLPAIMFGGFQTQLDAGKSLAHVRKFYGTFAILLLSTILALLLCNRFSKTHVLMGALPASMYGVNLVRNMKRAWLAELIHVILLIVIILSYLIH